MAATPRHGPPYYDYHPNLLIGPRRGGMAVSRLREHAERLGIPCSISVVTDTLVRRGDPQGHQYRLDSDGQVTTFGSPKELKQRLDQIAAETRDIMTPVTDIRKAYESLDREIQEDGNRAAENLSILLTKLRQMQALLSQRGNNKENRPDDLPTWTQYFAEFKDKFRLKLNLRSAQRAFKKMADLAGQAPPPRPKPLTLSAHDRRRLVEAAVTGNEIVRAWEKNGNVEAAIQEYKRITLDSRRLDSIVNPAEPEPQGVAKGGWWEELYSRLNALVPSMSDGNEHVMTTMLERAKTEPTPTPAEIHYRTYVIGLLRQIATEFTQSAETLESFPAPEAIPPKTILDEKRERQEKQATCQHWLADFLNAGERKKNGIGGVFSEGCIAGFSRPQLQRAADSLRVIRGTGRNALWRLPNDKAEAIPAHFVRDHSLTDALSGFPPKVSASEEAR